MQSFLILQVNIVWKVNNEGPSAVPIPPRHQIRPRAPDEADVLSVWRQPDDILTYGVDSLLDLKGGVWGGVSAFIHPSRRCDEWTSNEHVRVVRGF